MVNIAGSLNEIDTQTTQQLNALKHAKDDTNKMLGGNASVRSAIDTVNATIKETLDVVVSSVEKIQSAGTRTQKLATWVKSLDDRITAVEETLNATQSSNDEIASIAAQVNILAINAKIEAARAGEAGRGFAVVAEAINELSNKTAGAAEGISDNILTLSNWVGGLRCEASASSDDASVVLEEAGKTDLALSGIAEHVQMIGSETKTIQSHSFGVRDALGEFGQNIEKTGQSLEVTATSIRQVRAKTNAMVDQSKLFVQGGMAFGGIRQNS